jgi:hypothetical protein
MARKRVTCFISYAWEGKRHANWVNYLAGALAANGVFVHLDMWETYPGMEIARYMESSVRSSTHVLIICTTKYADRADGRKGGVGFETSIVTGQIFSGTRNKKKFVPILRQGEPAKAMPTYLIGKLHIDFRGRAFRQPLEDLLRHLFDEPVHKRPDIGTRPNFPTVVLPKKPSAKAKRAPKPKEKKAVVRKKQKELQRLMSATWETGSDRETRRVEAISRAATDLPDWRQPATQPKPATRRKRVSPKR